MFSGSIGLAGCSGNVPSSSKYIGMTVHGKAAEHTRHRRACHAVAGVDRERERLDRADVVDEGQAVIGKRLEHVELRDRAAPRGWRLEVAGDRFVAHLRQPGLDRDRDRFLEAKLEAVVTPPGCAKP